MLQRVGTSKATTTSCSSPRRDSRFGLKVAAPATWIKASAVMEADFSGTQPTEVSEQTSYVQNPLRMRHYYLKAETSVVDVLAGQYHDLFWLWAARAFTRARWRFLGVTGEVYQSPTPVPTLQDLLDVGRRRRDRRRGSSPRAARVRLTPTPKRVCASPSSLDGIGQQGTASRRSVRSSSVCPGSGAASRWRSSSSSLAARTP